MSEARKLDPGPEVGLGREPPVLDPPAVAGRLPDVGAAPQQPVPPPPEDAEADLSPGVAVARTAEAAPLTRDEPAPARRKASGPSLWSRATRAALIFFVIGLAAFAAGIALSSAILLGVLDLQTGWVKDALSAVKALVSQLSTK